MIKIKSQWRTLTERDQAKHRMISGFLAGRLQERGTMEWALRLKPFDVIQRMAILDLLEGPAGQKLREPWLSAWRVIEEMWQEVEEQDDTSVEAYGLQQRIRAGERSGALIAEITQLVEPRLCAAPHSSALDYSQKRAAKTIYDLFSVTVTSSSLLDVDTVEIAKIKESEFLLSLCVALDAAVDKGLDIARRFGWKGETGMWKLGPISRVYYVGSFDRGSGDGDPDEFSRGLAPAVKLLHEAVQRLLDLDPEAASSFVRKWQHETSWVHLRLCAAFFRDSRVASASEVAEFLLSLDDHAFWDPHDYPEVAELRARRFGEMGGGAQRLLVRRIRKSPPRTFWPPGTDRARIEKGRLFFAAREFRRIEVAGNILLKPDAGWLKERMQEFKELEAMTLVEAGFPTTGVTTLAQSEPENRYELLSGAKRLRELEVAFISPSEGWHENVASRVRAWLTHADNVLKILADLESEPDGGAEFPHVWDQFTRAHSPNASAVEGNQDRASELTRVLTLLSKLDTEAVIKAIRGISQWLFMWRKVLVNLAGTLNVWLKVWPVAVEVTNAEPADDLESEEIEAVAPENMKLQTLDTPVGKLVEVFIAACPPVQDRPFDTAGAPQRLRDTVIAATGKSGLIVRHRLTEALKYFLSACPEWTQEQLIAPLAIDNAEAIHLWRAIARSTQFKEVLELIGPQMVERASDRRLGRNSQRVLVFSIVIECLYAFKEKRRPAINYPHIEQMIRSIDDELRAYAADAIERFVRDLSVSRQGGGDAPSPEELFQLSVAPFLRQVWPQERSLTTPGVARAFADLPATAKEAFADAVEVVEPFLVPFDCWSMHYYGLYGELNGVSKLTMIDNPQKAAAFLQLLDLTVGTAERAVIPNDLPDALDRIRIVSPGLADDFRFRRLATAARRR